MAQQFEIGSKVRLNSAPQRVLTIAGERDGQFILRNDDGDVIGGAWATDLRAA